MRGERHCCGWTVVPAVFVAILFLGRGAAAQQEKILHSFGLPGDGSSPLSSLIFDAAGNLYSTTGSGGSKLGGTAFELIRAGNGWKEDILEDFINNATEPCGPSGATIFGANGNLYGTGFTGGSAGLGGVFELINTDGTWTERTIHSFGNGADGYYPWGNLLSDGAGNFYGTTSAGGYGSGGTVYELMPTAGGTWLEKTLYSFSNGTPDGEYPMAGVVFDSSGNIYGTTVAGGNCLPYGGCGVVFKLSPTASGGWKEQVIHNFGHGQDGSAPFSGVILDQAGNLYGTTAIGGKGMCSDGFGCGEVYELMPQPDGTWTEKILHYFNGVTDGGFPAGGLIFDAAGNLYGTTSGTVFELTPMADGSWKEKILHTFGFGKDGNSPQASLIFDADGNLYGTTASGGDYYGGTVFEITP